MFKFLKICSFILISSISLSAQPTRQQLRNLTAFTKLYGYVSYFHPSDEAQKLFWAKLAIAGSKKCIDAKNDVELLQALRYYFGPVAPSAKFFPTAAKLNLLPKDLTPVNKQNFEPVYWQHLGIYTGTNSPSYASIRVNRKSQFVQPYFGNLDTIQISPSLNLRDYIGKTFILSFQFENATPASSNALLIQPGDGLKNLVAIKPDTIKPGQKKLVKFTGTINHSGIAVFQMLVNTKMKQRIAYTDVQLEILNSTSPIRITINNTPEKLSNVSLTSDASSTYSFEINNAFDDSLFDRKVGIGECIKEEIVPGISCIVPLALYGNNTSTFPQSDSLRLNKFIAELNEAYIKLKDGQKTLTASLLPVRVGNIIMAWNVLQHSFPYWKDASSSSDAVLQKALTKSFVDRNADDFFVTLKLMSAPLNDGHMFITNDSDSLHRGTLPLIVGSVNGKIVIKKVTSYDGGGLFKPGDILLSIDKVPALKFLHAQETLLSGSPQWKKTIALTTFFQGPLHSKVLITISRDGRRKAILTERNSRYVGLVNGTAAYNHKTGWVKPGVYYFDLTSDTLDYRPAQLSNFMKAKSIIFDLRGYPRCSETYENIIPLILKKQQAERRFFMPQIVYPNFKEVTYDNRPVILKPKGINLNAHIFFITDASAQSAAETILSRVKDFKLGIIVGQPTSGTNGNINTISLAGGFSFSYSGMLVKNNDGSKHHLIGVIPDYRVSETLSGIKMGLDEVLNKTVELAKKQ